MMWISLAARLQLATGLLYTTCGYAQMGGLMYGGTSCRYRGEYCKDGNGRLYISASCWHQNGESHVSVLHSVHAFRKGPVRTFMGPGC